MKLSPAWRIRNRAPRNPSWTVEQDPPEKDEPATGCSLGIRSYAMRADRLAVLALATIIAAPGVYLPFAIRVGFVTEPGSGNFDRFPSILVRGNAPS